MSKSEFNKQAEQTRLLSSEMDALKGEFAELRKQSEAGRRKVEGEVEAIRSQIQPLLGIERVVERTNRAFIRSLKLQGAAARDQGSQLDALAAELERGLAPVPSGAD